MFDGMTPVPATTLLVLNWCPFNRREATWGSSLVGCSLHHTTDIHLLSRQGFRRQSIPSEPQLDWTWLANHLGTGNIEGIVLRNQMNSFRHPTNSRFIRNGKNSAEPVNCWAFNKYLPANFQGLGLVISVGPLFSHHIFVLMESPSER